MGSCAATTPVPNRSRSCSRTRSKLAFSRSMRLTTTRRGRWRCRARVPGLLGAHLQAVHGGDEQHRAVHHVQGGGDLAHEVGVPRGVHQVDLGVLPLQGEQGQVGGHPPALLVRVVVRGGGAVVYPPQAVDRAGGEQHRLGQRRLAVTHVRKQPDVADGLGRVDLHRSRLPTALWCSAPETPGVPPAPQGNGVPLVPGDDQYAPAAPTPSQVARCSAPRSKSLAALAQLRRGPQARSTRRGPGGRGPGGPRGWGARRACATVPGPHYTAVE